MSYDEGTENGSDYTRAQEIVRRIDREGDADALEGDISTNLFSQAKRSEMPWRDPRRLERLADSCSSISEMAREMDCHEGNLRRWCDLFGIQPPLGRGHSRSGLAAELVERSPDDIGTSQEPEGSA